FNSTLCITRRKAGRFSRSRLETFSSPDSGARENSSPAMKHRLVVCGAALLTVACLSASESTGQTADRKKSAPQSAPAANEPSPAANLRSGFASANPETRLHSGFASANPETRQRVVQEYGKLPLSFEANQGQVDGRVKFLSRGPGYQLFLLPDKAVL